MERNLAASALLALGCAFAGAAQDRPPRPLPGNPFPAYPPGAQQRGVEGVVAFRASVSADGSAEDVTILEVPEAGAGFDSAVKDAVLRWRFEPALKDGEPAASTYFGNVSFYRSLPKSQARMYPAKSAEVWQQVESLLRELRLKIGERDEEAQWLVTKFTSFDAKRFPDMTLPAATPQQVHERFQLHVFVPEAAEPARVYLGTIAESRLKGDRGQRRDLVLYNVGTVEDWFFRRLERRLGEGGHAIPLDPERRKEQARTLLGSPENPCLAPGEREPTAEQEVRPPEKLHDVHLLYPSPGLQAAKNAVVTVKSVLFEDGFVAQSKVESVAMSSAGTGDRVEFSEDEMKAQFGFASAAAVSLWRYRPAYLGECPVPIEMTVRANFSR